MSNNAASSKTKITEEVNPSGMEGNFNNLDPRYAHLSKEERQALVRALSLQSYHLPGNRTWWQDWRQYFLQNSHPILGICFHHPLHPISTCMRILFLVSSIVFGLTVTNLIWIWFVLDDRFDSEKTLVGFDVGLSTNSTLNTYIDQLNEENQFQVTTGMLILWTVGGLCHAIYDNVIWNLTLCACCMEGRKLAWAKKYKHIGVGLLSFCILVLLGGTTLVVVVRASLEEEQNQAVVKQELQSMVEWQNTAGLSTNDINSLWKNNDNLGQFVLGYTIELMLSLCVYFFIVGTIMFSGVFGCCKKSSLLGGRPYELQKLQRKQELNDNRGMEVVIDEEGGDVVLDGATK